MPKYSPEIETFLQKVSARLIKQAAQEQPDSASGEELMEIGPEDTVVSIALFKKKAGKYEVLVELHAKGKHMLPGGHVEEGELYAKTGARELKEETNISLKPTDLVFICNMFRDTDRDRSDILFGVIVTDADVKGMKPMSDAKDLFWSPMDEVPEMAFNHSLFIDKAYQKLTAREQHAEPDIRHAEEKTDKGTLIVLEGIDGSGKSSQVKILGKELDNCITSKWASSKVLKEAIKSLKNEAELTPQLYCMLNASDLVWRYENEILPALAKGKTVICDRYIYTSYVRDLARGTDAGILNSVYSGFRKPDIVVHCKVPLDMAFRRLKEDKGLSFYGSGMDMFISPDQDETCKVYQKIMDDAYDKLLPGIKGYFKLDTSKDIKYVAAKLKEHIADYMELRKKADDTAEEAHVDPPEQTEEPAEPVEPAQEVRPVKIHTARKPMNFGNKSPAVIAKLLGVAKRTAQRYKQHGSFTSKVMHKTAEEPLGPTHASPAGTPPPPNSSQQALALWKKQQADKYSSTTKQDRPSYEPLNSQDPPSA